MATTESVLATYLHPATIIHLDYGDELEREHGISWSMTGLACDASGFKAFSKGETFASVLAAKQATLDALDDAAGRPRNSCVTVEPGEKVTRRRDMNPHGFI